MSKQAPRDWREALAWMRARSKEPFGKATTPSGNWGGYCQSDCRQSYGLPSLFGSAWSQWLGLDDEDRHTGKIEDAPVGAPLFFRGGTYGHVMLAANPFKDGRPGAWSNDLVQYGMIDKVARTAPVIHWGQQYVGWGSSLNGYDLELKAKAKPKPKQNKRYKMYDRAIQNLERSLETAKRQGDKADAKVIRADIARLKKHYDNLRRR